MSSNGVLEWMFLEIMQLKLRRKRDHVRKNWGSRDSDPSQELVRKVFLWRRRRM
jgi:hypothetical protein